MKRFWNDFGRYKKYAVFCLFSSLAEAIVYMLIPNFMAKIFDIGLADKNYSYILNLGIIMIVLAVIAMALGIYSNYCSAVSAQGVGANLRESLFNHIMDFSSIDINRFTSSSLITRLNSDVNAVQVAVIQIMRMLFSGGWRIIIAIILALVINTKLALIIIGEVVIFFACLMLVFGAVIPWFPKMQKETDNLNLVTQENTMAQRVVKAFVRRKHEEEKFDNPNSKLTKIMKTAYGRMVGIMPLTTFIMNAAITAILWFGGLQTGAGGIGFGDLNMFVTYSIQVSGSLFLLTIVSGQLGRATTCIKRVYSVINCKPAINDPAKDKGLDISSGKIEFNDAYLKYDKNSPVFSLSNINLKIPKGQFLGIIGSTGEGKSSLVNLLPRLYDVVDGKVTIDGNDIRNFPISRLRRSIAAVPQQCFLFSGTIKDNIKWGNHGASDEEIISACRAAQAHDFIMSFPKGYDTIISQGGANISGGQRQRICIARALIKKAKILLMDDSTSALDTVTEAKIRQALQTDYKNLTILLVSQKISSVKNADVIIVMENGKISGMGTHEELLSSNQIYQEIYKSQMKGVA